MGNRVKGALFPDGVSHPICWPTIMAAVTKPREDSDWYLREWMRHCKKKQADMTRELGWERPRASKVYNSKTEYRRENREHFGGLAEYSTPRIVDAAFGSAIAPPREKDRAGNCGGSDR